MKAEEWQRLKPKDLVRNGFSAWWGGNGNVMIQTNHAELGARIFLSFKEAKELREWLENTLEPREEAP